MWKDLSMGILTWNAREKIRIMFIRGMTKAFW